METMQVQGSWAREPIIQKCPRCESTKCMDTGYHTTLDFRFEDGEEYPYVFIIYFCLKCGLQFRVWRDLT